MARTRKATPAQQAKVHTVMGEYKRGKLHSGPGKKHLAGSRKQAVAIAMSEAGLSRKKRKMKTKRYGESHMDRGLSYGNAPQGYNPNAGNPMGDYGKPPNGYVNHAGMPNASRAKRVLEYMSSYYGGNVGVNDSTNAGTSPNPRAMDSTYKGGKK